MCKLIDETMYDNFIFDFTYIKIEHTYDALLGKYTIIFDMYQTCNGTSAWKLNDIA